MRTVGFESPTAADLAGPKFHGCQVDKIAAERLN